MEFLLSFLDGRLESLCGRYALLVRLCSFAFVLKIFLLYRQFSLSIDFMQGSSVARA